MKRSTIVFTVIVLALIGFTFFDRKKTQDDETKKSEESVVVKLKADQISNIEIAKESETIKLKKEADGWTLSQIQKNVNDLADQSVVRDFIESLAKEKATETAKEGEGVDWKIYGLEKPKAKITVRDNAGQTFVVEVGSRKNFEGQCFLRLNSGKKVLISSAVWDTHAGKTAKELRDKKAVRVAQIGADKIELKGEDLELLLTKKGDVWSSAKKPDLKLDTTKVKEILTVVSELRVTEFLSEEKPKSLEAFVRSQASNDKTKNDKMKILKIFLHNREKVFNGEIVGGVTKQGAATYYFTSSEQPRVFKIESPGPEKLLKLTLDSLRDREEAFAFNVDDIKEIHSENALRTATLVKQNKNGNWELQQAVDSLEVDETQVRPFLDKMRALRVAEFSDKDLSMPNKIFLLGMDRKVVFDLKWSKETFEIGKDGAKKKYFVASTNKSQKPFAVEESSILALAPQSLLKNKAFPAATPAAATNAEAKNRKDK